MQESENRYCSPEILQDFRKQIGNNIEEIFLKFKTQVENNSELKKVILEEYPYNLERALFNIVAEEIENMLTKGY
ncbi:MAG: hypothetical protein LC122_13750 [Chitinophagales bacterium]|nr:hypothetical protein [Chitinophagales bacterium]